MFIVYVTTCDTRYEQQFVWHPATYNLKSVHYNLCVQRDNDTIMRLRNCSSNTLTQKFFAADFRIKMSNVGNWGLCLGSQKANISDNLVQSVNCWTTPDNRTKYTMYSLNYTDILAQNVKTGKDLLKTMIPKSTFW